MKKKNFPKVRFPARQSNPEGVPDRAVEVTPKTPPIPAEPVVESDPLKPYDEGSLWLLVEAMKQDVELLGGTWTSSVQRLQEEPPSAAVHFMLDGKRYVAIFQPTDMQDRSAH